MCMRLIPSSPPMVEHLPPLLLVILITSQFIRTTAPHLYWFLASPVLGVTKICSPMFHDVVVIHVSCFSQLRKCTLIDRVPLFRNSKMYSIIILICTHTLNINSASGQFKFAKCNNSTVHFSAAVYFSDYRLYLDAPDRWFLIAPLRWL